jgi:hypothetical protein
MEPDFSGWATKAGRKCADGRTIMPKAFEHQDKITVPLVWQHGHKSPDNVLGHAVLEARPEGVYTYGYFNTETPQGRNVQALVRHGDITRLSIFANNLVEKSKQVVHGMIREVSTVIAGANPDAIIDYVKLQHSDDTDDYTILDDEAIIHTGEDFEIGSFDEEELAHAAQTVRDIYNSMSEDQKDAVHVLIDAALEEQAGSAAHSDNGEGNLEHQEGNVDVTNVFEKGAAPAGQTGSLLAHDDLRAIAKRVFTGEATFKEALSHALEEKGSSLAHGIENLSVLFPEARAVNGARPTWITRRMEWVAPFLASVSKTPFSRVRTNWADISQEESRALGYIKGTYKKEEWFKVGKRTTGPAMIIKKQKLDRQDIIDVEDFDLVAWMREEMEFMIKEELATAILIGDNRAIDDPDKIPDPAGETSGDGIRSILLDHEMYAVQINVNVGGTPDYMKIVDALTMSRQYYKGAGNPTLYTTETHLARFLLIRDETNSNRRLYRTVADLAAELRVKDIVTVETMQRVPTLLGIIVNPSDYNLGASKGGELTNFDDFDIDYNQYKYLIETYLSGALTVPFSALVIKLTTVANLVTPTVPSFVRTTGVVTIPTQTGVVYKDDANVTLTAGAQTALDPGESLIVHAVPASTYYFPDSVSDGPWEFKRPAA